MGGTKLFSTAVLLLLLLLLGCDKRREKGRSKANVENRRETGKEKQGVRREDEAYRNSGAISYKLIIAVVLRPRNHVKRALSRN